MSDRIRKLLQEVRREIPGLQIAGPHASQGTWGVYRKRPAPVAAQGLPFRTRTAEKVFQIALNLTLEYPELGRDSILRQAIQDLGSPPSDLTPEDIRLLEIGLDQAMNGPPPRVSRTGGAPGGPLRHTGPNVSRSFATEDRIRSAAKLLREFMAHPQALGTTGMFSGGHSLPYPGSATFTKRRLWDDEAPNPWEYKPEDPEKYFRPRPNPWTTLLTKLSKKKGRRAASSQ